MDYYLGEIFFDNCVNMNGAPRMRTPSRRSGARSCHAPGGVAARGPPVGVLRSVARRRAESRFWGVFIAVHVHRAFVLGLGSRHRGIVKLSEGSLMCDSVRLLYFTYLLNWRGHTHRSQHTEKGTYRSGPQVELLLPSELRARLALRGLTTTNPI